MSPRPSEESSSISVVERVRSILASKGLTLYRVSQKSAALYGRFSPYFVPHNLYYDLRGERFTPSIHQLFALSRVSGYRVQDWMRVFNFDLASITRLQVRLPSKRTILLDTSAETSGEWTAELRNLRSTETIPAIAPLAQLLDLAPLRKITALPQASHRFLYAKIGYEDAIAFPELVPGSIVRIDPNVGEEFRRLRVSSISDRFFLIEHSKGFYCCRVRALANGIVVPVNNELTFAQIELRVPQEAKVRGFVDLEFRPLLKIGELHVPTDLAHRWRPLPLRSEQTFGQLLRDARRRSHISTREAAAKSLIGAQMENDVRYQCSSSSLNEYELRNVPPRDLHRIFMLCSIYGLQLASLLRAMGTEPGKAGAEFLPGRYLRRGEPSLVTAHHDEERNAGVSRKLLEAFRYEVPLFLGNLLDYFADSQHVSSEDMFWIGGDDEPLHPYLVNGLIAVVNRRRKAPTHFLSKPLWQQPIYVFLTRDGRYRAACCGLEDDKLVVHPYGPDFHRSSEYRYHHDAEVVGQVVAVARRFPV